MIELRDLRIATVGVLCSIYASCSVYAHCSENLEYSIRFYIRIAQETVAHKEAARPIIRATSQLLRL